MRCHIFGLNHTVTDPTRYTFCAYTQKVEKLTRMLNMRGIDVVHYGVGDAVVAGTHVKVMEEEDRDKIIPPWADSSKEYGPLHTEQYYKGSDIIAKKIVAAMCDHIKDETDIFLCPFGSYHKYICDQFPKHISVESGIGYSGVFSKYRVFESYAWMHYVYGIHKSHGSWYDCVIPNSWDKKDFYYDPGEANHVDHPYYLVTARLNEGKGIGVALEMCRRKKTKLYVIGQGDLDRFDTEGCDVTHLGTMNKQQLRPWMAHAEALIQPTIYVEPFGGTTVEAQLCGTPVITTDWGVYNETVHHGLTGFRCRSLDDFLRAMDAVKDLDNGLIAKIAAKNYTLETVSFQYESYLKRLHELWDGDGWNTQREKSDLTGLVPKCTWSGLVDGTGL